MKTFTLLPWSRSLLIGLLIASASCAEAEKISESQAKWIEKYQKQKNAPKPEEQLINTDPEPSLEGEFKPLFNGKDLTGWTPRGGECTFEVKDGSIVGTCVPGSPSTYLCTDRSDFKDFIFTCEVKWEVDGNTGIQFRSKHKPGKKGETVYGPQVEMEDDAKDRGWSGGIYGQSCGGYYYPLWLDAHEKVRQAIDYTGWNRVTILGQGPTAKTWINGIPAAHIENEEFVEGFFALQVHSGKKGTIHFRNIRVKELK